MLHYHYEGMMCVLQSLCYLWCLLVTAWAGFWNYRGKDTSNPPSVDSLLCAQSKQHQLCCALFSLRTEHKIALWMSKYVQHRKGSRAENFLIIQHQLNGLAASEPHPEHVLFVLPTNPLWTPLPPRPCFLLKTGKGVGCGVAAQNRCEGTIWRGLEELSYCVPWHAELLGLKKLHFSFSQSL